MAKLGMDKMADDARHDCQKAAVGYGGDFGNVWWWFLTNFKCDTKASKSDQPGKDSVCIRNPCNSPSDSMKGSISCARASKSAC